MRKSKMMKALLVFGMSAVTATSMIGLVACNSEEGENPADTHTHNYGSWTPDGATGHKRECTADGECDKKTETAAHDVTTGTCPTCGYVFTTGGGEITPPSTQATVVWKVDDNFTASTLEAEIELKADMGVYAGPGLVFEASSGKKLTYKGTQVAQSSNRVKFNADGTKDTKYLRVNVKEDATVIVYAWSGTGGSPAYLKMLDVSGADIAGTKQKVSNGTNNEAWAAVFDVKANTDYYIVSTGKTDEGAGNSIFNYVAVDYNFKETKTSHEATPNDCENAGNIAYSVSDYDRYFDGEGNLISREEISKNLGPKGHQYSIKPNGIVIPTNDVATNQGKVTFVCANGHETDVSLPILSDPKYTQTEITGSTDVTYSITLAEMPDSPVTFVAAPAKQTKYKFETIYDNLFSTAITSVGYGATNANQLADGLKMYGLINQTDATAYSTGISQTVTTNGRLEIRDTNTSDTAYNYIVFDTAKTTGVYKISGTLHMPTQNGSWSIFQLIGSNVASVTDSAFAAIRSQGDKKLGISTQNSNNDVTLTTANAYTKATDYTFEIVLNLEEKTITLKIGSEEVVSEMNAISIKDSLGANGWQGIRLQTAGSERNVYLSNLTIAERVVDTSEDA